VRVALRSCGMVVDDVVVGGPTVPKIVVVATKEEEAFVLIKDASRCNVRGPTASTNYVAT